MPRYPPRDRTEAGGCSLRVSPVPPALPNAHHTANGGPIVQRFTRAVSVELHMPAQLEWKRNGKRSTLTVFKQEVVIGRDPACQIRGDAAQLASRHCRIAEDGARFVARPLAGTATLVNGVPITRRELADGDVIECATFTVRFTEARTAGARPAPVPPPAPAPTPAPAPAPPA